MAICAHEPGKARGKCPSKKVAREFSFKRKKKSKSVGDNYTGRYLT